MPDDANGSNAMAGPSTTSSTSATPGGRTNKNQRNASGTATTSTAGTVRRSPPTNENGTDGRPPTKRARKAINCEPCRNSKLKCDRNRPCSSCVLRGTSALCYQDGRGFDESASRGDDLQYARIDPAQEISRLRQSINLLEAYIFPASRNQHRADILSSQNRRPSDSVSVIPKKEELEPDHAALNDKASHTGSAPNVGTTPGVLGTKGQAGGPLYAGSTSVLNLLAHSDSRHSEEADQARTSTAGSHHHSEEPSGVYAEYDSDLIALLPQITVIDELIQFYFEFCNWIYRHVNQAAFTKAWQRFKDGSAADRTTLATACAIIAVASHYLPSDHHILQLFHESQEDIGLKFYEISTTALQRRLLENRTYSMELIELYLIRAMYQTIIKANSEEIWHIRGELFTIATAMGLHRDPSRWKMARDIAERRRWAWWHIILLERWQAFLLGRPLTIASHHFDTQLPSYCDPALDKTGRLYLPNIALFRLAYILGDIMDDAVSVRPVPYESVLANDRALQRWMEELPHELDLDEYKIARSLASNNVAQRRFGVQSVIIRTSYYHIRVTLHRPYAAKASAILPSLSPGKSSQISTSHPKDDPSRYHQSLDIAVSSAEKLITMVDQSRPDFLANSSLAVPGHMNWGPWHCFSAAMFFSFQLIANPDQPGAGLFRACIRKAMGTLQSARGNGNALADKGVDILGSLEPLYTTDYGLAGLNGGGAGANGKDEERQREQILNRVRKLAFPYHDTHDPRMGRGSTDSPSVRGGNGLAGSPAGSNSVSPPLTAMNAHSSHGYDNSSASLRTQAAYNNANNGLQSPTAGGMMYHGGHATHATSSPVTPSAYATHHGGQPSNPYPNSHTLPPLPTSHLHHSHSLPHQQQHQGHPSSSHHQPHSHHGHGSNPHSHSSSSHHGHSSHPSTALYPSTPSTPHDPSIAPMRFLSAASNYGPSPGSLGLSGTQGGLGGGLGGGPSNPVDEMWGASLGFGSVEWSAFEGAASAHGHGGGRGM